LHQIPSHKTAWIITKVRFKPKIQLEFSQERLVAEESWPGVLLQPTLSNTLSPPHPILVPQLIDGGGGGNG
jgi:hypothetical protein